MVDGYNLPMIVFAQGVSGPCNATGCISDLNMGCPKELQQIGTDGAVIGCKSACLAFGLEQFCCSGAHGNPSTCQPSYYSKIFKRACPTAYSYAYDDATSTFTCKSEAYHIVFCPNTGNNAAGPPLPPPPLLPLPPLNGGGVVMPPPPNGGGVVMPPPLNGGGVVMPPPVPHTPPPPPAFGGAVAPPPPPLFGGEGAPPPPLFGPGVAMPPPPASPTVTPPPYEESKSYISGGMVSSPKKSLPFPTLVAILMFSLFLRI
ncbi:unnamed protein product [Cuscuta campestris]|uniref:Thaumatin-like protein n=1 Tax=Cuscuta campestris TaxID=132261 RepID=A0A484KLS5_9ASTE|nr:unnamed protein product [Cuscuta campestris]